MPERKNITRRDRASSWLGWFDAKLDTGEGQVGQGARTAVLFWLVVAAAFVIRALVLWQLSRNYPGFLDPIVDSRWHYLWAKQIAAGDWLGSEVFFRAPLYPYLLGIWIKLFGDGLWPIRLMQAFIGGLTAGLTFLIGQKAFGRRVGLIAAVMSILYGTLIYYESELLIEVIAVPLGLLAIWMAMNEASRPAPRWVGWLGVGLLLGLGAISRPNILACVPAFWWWAWGRDATGKASWGRRLRGPMLVTLGVIIPIIPVTIRNYVVADDPVVISYQGGINLWLGNNPAADGLTMQMPEIDLDETVEWNEFVRTTDSIAVAQFGRKMTASEISAFWTKRAKDWMLANPGDAIRGWLKKTWYFLGGYEVSDQTDIYAYSRFSAILNVLISQPLIFVPFGLIVPFGLLGLILVWRRSEATRPLVAFFVLYAPTVILFLATARHRLPVVPILIVCAAAALWQFRTVFQLHGRKALIVPAILALLLGIALNQRTLQQLLNNPAFFHYQIGLAYDRRDQRTEAIDEYEKAITYQPRHYSARKNLAFDLVKVGAYDSAVSVSFRCMELRRDDAEVYNNVGLAYLGLGDTAKAEGSWRVAIRTNPKLPQAMFNLGEVARTRNDEGAALGYYVKAIEADSNFTAAYSGVAIIYSGAGNYNVALDYLKMGLRHVPDHAILQANLGALYLRMNRPDDAVVPLERAIYWEPQADQTRINLAIAYARLEKAAPALAQLRVVLAHDPHNETAQKLIKEIKDAAPGVE
jgi:tetratricopeptide (TPR) repeat protein